MYGSLCQACRNGQGRFAIGPLLTPCGVCAAEPVQRVKDLGFEYAFKVTEIKHKLLEEERKKLRANGKKCATVPSCLSAGCLTASTAASDCKGLCPDCSVCPYCIC